MFATGSTFKLACLVAVACMTAGGFAHADEQLASAPGAAPGRSLVINEFGSERAGLTIASTSPTFGALSVGLESSSDFTSTSGAIRPIGQPVGVPSINSGLAPADIAPFASLPAARNLGASVGYGGFYVRGAFTDVVEHGLVDTWQSWQAGFGYGFGNLDLRLTYVSSDATNGLARSLMDLDTNQWMIGGIYQISPGIRVNADAFYGTSQSPAPYRRLTAAPGGAAPQGAGARVGVQLRF